MRIDVLGVGIDDLTKAEFTARAEELLRSGKRGYCVTPNGEILYEAVRDPRFRQILNGAALVLPDGAGVVLVSGMLGTPLKEKVAGVEFGWEICALLARTGDGLFLLGSEPGVAEQAARRLQAAHPGLVVRGTCDGYRSDGEAAARIADSGARVVFVCTGSPKQEFFMSENLERSGAALMLGLGGSLDIYAGRVKRAPQWMIRWNLEWFYRLVKEPWRLGRMMRLPRFLWLCRKEKGRRKWVN